MDIVGILGKIGFDPKMFLFNAINFLIVLFLVRKFFFKQILATLSKRQEIIKDGLDKAEMYTHEVNMARQKSDEIIDSSKVKANEIVIKAQKEADELAAQRKVETDQEIADMQAKAQEKLEIEKRTMIEKVKTETAELAIMATEKIIKEKLDPAKDKKIIDDYLKELDSK